MENSKNLYTFLWKDLAPLATNASIYVRSATIQSDPLHFHPHHHNYYCGFYVTEGEYVVSFEDHTVRVGKHQCMLISPNTVHYISEETETTGYALAINPDLLMHTFMLHLAPNQVYSDFFYKYFLGADASQQHILIQDRFPEISIPLLERIQYELEINDALTKDLAEIGFITFLAQLSRSAPSPDSDAVSSASPSLPEILSYIEEHSASATLQSTAEYFHYNASYLSRILSQETGKTFREWQKQYRLSKAVALLENTDYCIDIIAQFTGYTNTTYFYRAFQSMYEMTPAQYRRAYREAHDHIRILPKGSAIEHSDTNADF
ncbi:MAG: helix-turn-helix transcriptional regulator [Lachnospiraceae bacterium]|nr:helix-turn-helix transcriptional regulator [Lachnospiraceae bacterium]